MRDFRGAAVIRTCAESAYAPTQRRSSVLCTCNLPQLVRHSTHSVPLSQLGERFVKNNGLAAFIPSKSVKASKPWAARQPAVRAKHFWRTQAEKVYMEHPYMEHPNAQLN